MPAYARGMPQYQMPAYAVPMQQQRPRGARGRGGVQKRNFNFTGQARNQPQMQQ